MQTGSDNDLDDEARWGSDGVLINGNPTSGSPCEFLWHSIVFSKYIHSRFHIHKEQWRGQQPFPSMDGKVASSWGHSTKLKCQQILNVTGPAGHFPLKTSLPCFGTTVHTHKIQGMHDWWQPASQDLASLQTLLISWQTHSFQHERIYVDGQILLKLYVISSR